MQRHATLRRSGLTLTLALTTFSLAQQPAPPTTWHLVDQLDADANRTTRLLTISSTNTYTSTDGSPQHAILQIKCLGSAGGSATVAIDSNDIIAVKTDATTTLPVRLDTGPVMAAAWANLSTHRVLVYDLCDLLPSHGHMTIDLPLGPTRTQSFSFDLSQLASTMRDSNCRRRL